MALRKRGYLVEAARKGHCYQTAAEHVMFRAKPGDVLVHGRPTLQVPPYREYGHAWIERGDQVIDNETGYKGPRAMYYSLGNIDYRKNLVYTVEQAKEFMLSHKHYGP